MEAITIALEHARRDCLVDHFDQGAAPITRAGLQNEGKLHLGVLGAKDKDATLETSRIVATGSLSLFALPRRWIGPPVDRLPCSAPRVFAVPNNSMLAPDRIHDRLTRVEDAVRRPAGLPGTSPDPKPPAVWNTRAPGSDAALIAGALRALTALRPGVAKLAVGIAKTEVIQGAIHGFGERDITHVDTGLHRRSATGARSVDGDHGIDPGKYCQAPWFAGRVAGRVADQIMEDAA